jgi:hypothetical protein
MKMKLQDLEQMLRLAIINRIAANDSYSAAMSLLKTATDEQEAAHKHYHDVLIRYESELVKNKSPFPDEDKG